MVSDASQKRPLRHFFPIVTVIGSAGYVGAARSTLFGPLGGGAVDCPRRTSVYVPGVVFGCTSIVSFASFAPAAIVASGWGGWGWFGGCRGPKFGVATNTWMASLNFSSRVTF